MIKITIFVVSMGLLWNASILNQILANSVYRGVCGAYTFTNAGPGELTCIPYPDETPDPSIGMAHLTFQIQNGEQVLIAPDPYTTGSFQLPEWL